MLLFKEDWNTKYPNAIVDTQCKNESFIRVCALLKEMGIENHLFPLQLHDRSLIGVDPFDPKLTAEQMVAIAVECRINPWWFFRNCIRDPSGSIIDPISFKANRATIAGLWCFLTHTTTIITLQRQIGKSFLADSIAIWLMNLACTNTNINLLTKDTDLRSKNMIRLKNLDEELPFFLRMRTKNDIANTEEMKVTSLGNTYTGYLPKASPKQALNVARGNSASVNFIDEFPYLVNIGISLPVMFSTGTAAREISERKGEPYGNLIYTTAGKRDDRDGKYAYNMIQNSAVWTEKFYDCKNLADLEATVRRNSPSGENRIYATFVYSQLGKTKDWFNKVVENAQVSGDELLRDFYCVWTSGTNTSPLSKELMEEINNSKASEIFSEISSPYGYVTRWFMPENDIQHRMASSKFIMSCDTSDASGSGDDIALIVRDVRNGAVVAAGTYNETNLITFAEWLCQWLIKYPNITLIVERRSTGSMILDYLLLMLPSKDIDPFARLYNQAVQYADEYPDRYKEICKPMYARSSDIYVKCKKLFGFATSANGATSRSELYSVTLQAAAKMTGSLVFDPKTIEQILGLEIRNGRVDHTEGGHDDMVIAWLLSYWLISLGKNLQHYGINSREILMDNRINKEDNNPMAVYERREQDYLRREVESLVEQLVNEHDEYASMILERKLRLTANKLNEADKETLSMDELIGNIKDSKRMNARNRMRYY